jgi:transmembrane sensor
VTLPADPSDPGRLLDQALDWVVRLKAGEPTRADIDALQLWRSQSLAHEKAFKSAARLMRDASAAAKELSDNRPDIRPRDLGSRALPPTRHLTTRRAFLGGAAAAAAAGYFFVRPPFDLWPSLQELSADFRTGKGEQRKVNLASNVSLELNTQTSLALRSETNVTEIELISGEASVFAKLPSSKSLVMVAANGRVSAVQADFNARCLDDVVSVTCLNGTIDVAHAGKTVQLHTAEQISYSASGGIAPVVPVDPGQITAWQVGQLIFRDRPLGSVVEEVNRYRPGKIIITSAGLRERVVNGTFQLNKLENFAAQVEQLFGARSTTLPGGIVLLS